MPDDLRELAEAYIAAYDNKSTPFYAAKDAFEDAATPEAITDLYARLERAEGAAHDALSLATHLLRFTRGMAERTSQRTLKATTGCDEEMERIRQHVRTAAGGPDAKP